MERLESCLLCGADAGMARVVQEREGHALVRCPDCGLVYANPQYTDAELARLYEVHYYGAGDAFGGGSAEKERARNRPLYVVVLRDLLRRYPRLRPRPGAPVRVLDFGCGPGYFLAECRDLGMEASGIEFSPPAAGYARARLGLDVRDDWRQALAELPEGGFELVCLWEVLEHLRRPREAVEALVRALAPGGVFCVTTPSLGCWRYYIEGARWFNMQNPTHVVFFGRETLGRLLRECGLAGVVRPVFWGGRPGFGPLANFAQYLARAAGLGSDLRLYARRPTGG